MKLNTLLTATTLVLISELLLLKLLNIFFLPILTIMIVKIVQIIGLYWILKPKKLNLLQGFKTGLLWSALSGNI